MLKKGCNSLILFFLYVLLCSKNFGAYIQDTGQETVILCQTPNWIIGLGGRRHKVSMLRIVTFVVTDNLQNQFSLGQQIKRMQSSCEMICVVQKLCVCSCWAEYISVKVCTQIVLVDLFIGTHLANRGSIWSLPEYVFIDLKDFHVQLLP